MPHLIISLPKNRRRRRFRRRRRRRFIKTVELKVKRDIFSFPFTTFEPPTSSLGTITSTSGANMTL